MRVKTVPMPELRGPVQSRLAALHRVIVAYFRLNRQVVNVNEDMSSSRIRSFLGG